MFRGAGAFHSATNRNASNPYGTERSLAMVARAIAAFADGWLVGWRSVSAEMRLALRGRLCGWIGSWAWVGWVGGWLAAGQIAEWVAGWVGGCLLAGWLAGSLLAGWLDGFAHLPMQGGWLRLTVDR